MTNSKTISLKSSGKCYVDMNLKRIPDITRGRIHTEVVPINILHTSTVSIAVIRASRRRCWDTH